MLAWLDIEIYLENNFLRTVVILHYFKAPNAADIKSKSS